MADVIGGYRCLTPMRTTGSGSARWCVAERGRERFFLKQFLTPVYPPNEDTELRRKQKERCERFEDEKQRLYAAISCVIGETLIPVLDFFRFEGHYYSVSECAQEDSLPGHFAAALSDDEKKRVLYDLASCLQRLHRQGVVHADLKPEHVLLEKRGDRYRARLIDLDSGFLVVDPPADVEGDPAFLAPETYLRMSGRPIHVDAKADTFAFGALIHCLWTGDMPAAEGGGYLYEAALEDRPIVLSPDLPPMYADPVRRMLSVSAEERPDDVTVTALFADDPEPAAAAPYKSNALSKFMKKR